MINRDNYLNKLIKFKDKELIKKEKMNADKMNYIFIDEVQNVPEFQKAVDGLYIQKNTDIYINGSNAYLLSGELATLLSGRYADTTKHNKFYVRYDIKGKKYLKTGDKYYVADLGLRYFLLGRKKQGRGHILENVVYLEL